MLSGQVIRFHLAQQNNISATSKDDICCAILKHFRWLLTNPYLIAIREGLTFALPAIVAGTLAILINQLPWPAYQDLMGEFFGVDNWRMLGGYIWNGSLGVLAVIMCLSIASSLTEDYNSRNPAKQISTSLAAVVTISSLMCTMEPAIFEDASYLSFQWVGVYGLLWATIIALTASFIFRFFLTIKFFRITFYSGSSDTSMARTMDVLIPGVLTIIFFAAIKTLTKSLGGIDEINRFIYDLVYMPFDRMDLGLFETANIYGVARHLLWFFGIHGSNVLEPIMTQFYSPGTTLNQELLAAGQAPIHIFTKPFFDCYSSIGGSGSTLGLIIACLWKHKDSGARKIAKISFPPALINVNEIILYGLPVVLNPIFLVPFILVPLVLASIAYMGTAIGWVPVTINEVPWNAPVFLNAYMATGESWVGLILQVFNTIVAVFIYLPFVLLDNRLKAEQFDNTFKRLIQVTSDGEIGDQGPRYIGIPDTVGSLARGLAHDLEQALGRGEIYLEYQPQVNSSTGKAYGVESLMRWRHPQIGPIPPSVFIGLAEDSGFITKLGLWGLDESCRQASLWRNLGADIVMSVNVSATQLDSPDFSSQVFDILSKYRLPMENLKLEVTESIALSGRGHGKAVLEHLSNVGIKLAIDDFGMGHTSLSYIKQFPVDTLKLDSILSRDVLVSRSSCEIISSIAELCRSLGISLIAEFVEDEAHLMKLRSLGCVNIQGYYYSPPLPPDEAYRFIMSQHEAYYERSLSLPAQKLKAENEQ